MYTDVQTWTVIPTLKTKTCAKLMAPFQDIFGALEQVTNYCSLVDMRCRPFIHWRSVASA
jgi:hypothetical protein